jgi:hypothetical protein
MPPNSRSVVQSDREYRNDLVVTIDDDDLVTDDELPESPPLRLALPMKRLTPSRSGQR